VTVHPGRLRKPRLAPRRVASRGVAFSGVSQPSRMPTPVVVGVHLDGELPPWVASKDLIGRVKEG
jgi:hypothetical protein